MPLIILDLDHTLLDTTAFKAALARSLEIEPAAWEKAYTQFVHDNGMFNAVDFLRGVTPAQHKAFAKTLTQIRRFFYPDSWPFLRQAQAAGYKVMIVTFGDIAWQQQKIDALRLPSFVESLVTNLPKIERLAEYIEHVTVVVDDRATELEALYEHWPQLTLYWMRRPNGKYRDIVPVVPHQPITQLNEIKL